MLKHERNYATVEKECLAIKWAIHHLRYYLWGRQFTLVTDHAPLKWMSTSKDQNARVTRWFLELQNYKFTVEHRPGKAIPHADALSRQYEEAVTSPPGEADDSQRGGVCGISLEYNKQMTGKHAPRATEWQKRESAPPAQAHGRVIEGRYIPQYLLNQTDTSHLQPLVCQV